MSARQRRLRTLLFTAVALVTALVAVTMYLLDLGRNTELDTVDTRFSIRGKVKPPDDLMVVNIDEGTFETLKERWPFARAKHAKVVDRIAADRPKVIAYDLELADPSDEPRSYEDDTALAESILDANGKFVAATAAVNQFGEARFLDSGVKLQREIGVTMGNAILPTDPGGAERRIYYEWDKLKTFSIAAAEVAAGRKVDRDSLGGDTAWIDYHGPPGTIPSVPFGRIHDGKTPRGMFRGKVVVVGQSSPSLQDLHTTPTSGEGFMTGAELQANAISTVLRGFPLKAAPAWLEVILIVLMACVAPLASLRLRAMPALALALVTGIAYAVVTQLTFNGGTVLAFVHPIGALVVATVAAIGAHYITGAMERERMHDLFSRFVPENVVDEVLAQADGLRLGGVQREGTVLFSDLRGFTSFAESLPVDQVIEILNRYLTAMSDAILDHGGTLVAYMGDGIMAVFGAPVAQDDHADRALAAAREMLDVRLPGFNESLREMGAGEGFRMGIGLNSGSVMSGNVGSERRLEYTAIGDTTNTASRIEGMTKGTAHQLFLADSTRQMLRNPPGDLIFVDEFEVRGRQAKVKLWTAATVTSPPADRVRDAP